MKKVLLLFLLLIPFYIHAESCDSSLIKIESIELSNINGSAEELSNATIEDGKIKIGLKLYEVEDYAEYDIKIKNESQEDYYLDKDSFVNKSNYIDYTFISSDNIVKVGEEKTIKLKVEYKNKVPTVELGENTFSDNKTFIVNYTNANPNEIVNPKTGVTNNLIIIGAILLVSIIGLLCLRDKEYIEVMSILLIIIIPMIVKATCTYGFEVDSKIEISEKEAVFDIGENVNIKMKQLAGDDTSENGMATVDENIVAIKKSNSEPTESNKTVEHIVSTDYSYYPIYMWFDNGTIYWWSEDGTPSMNSDSSRMFAILINLINIEGLASFSVEKVIDLTGLFMGYTNAETKLTNLTTLKDWNTSNVTKMDAIFQLNTSLTDLTVLKNWDISNVSTMQYMFYGCSSLNDITSLSNWNTSNVTTTQGMFYNCISLVDFSALTGWDVSSVENMRFMFGMGNGKSKTGNPIISLEPLRNWNVSKVTNMSCMFQNVNIESYLPLSNWDVSKVDNFSNMFNQTSYSTTTSLAGLENWDVSSAKNMEMMFEQNVNLTDASAINDWNITGVTSFLKMFRDTPIKPEFSKVSGSWDSNGTFVPN